MQTQIYNKAMSLQEGTPLLSVRHLARTLWFVFKISTTLTIISGPYLKTINSHAGSSRAYMLLFKNVLIVINHAHRTVSHFEHV